jgi:hypothetical protein
MPAGCAVGDDERVVGRFAYRRQERQPVAEVLR